MNRQQLEHLIRAAGEIANDDELIIIGSQAILGQYPDAPEALRMSMEADIIPKNDPSKWNVIDGCIGEFSPFHELYGYYAQGVGLETAVLPSDWQQRLIPIRNANTRERTGYCLEAHDLAISKLIAGRERDLVFLENLVQYGMIAQTLMQQRLRQTALSDAHRGLVEARLNRLFSR
jgi:hypothetical protein